MDETASENSDGAITGNECAVADLLVIGGGIVGLATAYRWINANPGKHVVVLEKETRLAQHQTGRNSGVLHTGIYYRPGSLKSRLCRDGKLSMESFCTEENIPFERCGKVIVATDESEFVRLDAIYARGKENGVVCELIGRERLSEIEPHAAGLKAIYVPEAGIVDYPLVTRRLAERVREAGGHVITGARFEGLVSKSPLRVSTSAGEFVAKQIVNCTGLQVDRVSRRLGVRPAAKIVPFRGEYFELADSARKLCRGLIYPVPDPAFPFLGVHFTKMIDGSVECGPNAVLALAREGYRWRDVRVSDVVDSLGYRGFQRLAKRHWRIGSGEIWRSVNKSAFVTALQRLVPEIRSKDLTAVPAGVRAQALLPDGSLVDDFLIEGDEHIISVANAPSPAATSALEIGGEIVRRIGSAAG